jgi:hypothetical protein
VELYWDVEPFVVFGRETVKAGFYAAVLLSFVDASSYQASCTGLGVQ